MNQTKEFKEIGVYFSQVSKSTTNITLTREEVVDFLTRIRQGDDNALEQFLSKNLKTILSVIKKKQLEDSSLKLENLLPIGNTALIHAMDTYDLSSNIDFTSYAKSIIESRL